MAVYSNSGICYIIEVNSVNDEFRDLTGEELDNNFRLLYYSSSLHNDGQTLRLHRDIGDDVRNNAATWRDPYETAKGDDVIDYYTLPAGVTDYDDIQLPTGGSGGASITITGNTDNNILTATGTSTSIQGESKLKFDGSKITLTGSIDLTTGGTCRNIFIGEEAGCNNTSCTVSIGYKSGENLTGTRNTTLGIETLTNAGASSRTVAIGACALQGMTSGNFNTGIGASAGINITSGDGNVLIGCGAGPSSGTALSSKLYINNTSGDPLICGDFSTGHVKIKTAVSASQFSGSFAGDGSSLTGLSLTAFPHNGDAVITGSLTVSGSDVNVDLTKALSISGSVFSGSFVGDGSGITGVTSTAFPHNGNAVITGSLTVSGSGISIELQGNTSVSSSLTVNGIATLDETIKVHAPNVYSIGIGEESLGTSTASGNTVLGYQAGCCINTSTNVVAIGYKAGKQAGSSSTGVGTNTLGNNSGGTNTAIGENSMGGSSSTGGSNTGIGYYSNYSITSGCLNTGAGYQALSCVSSGERNTGVGNDTLKILATGCNNTAIGSAAGCKTVSGNCNVYIGNHAGPSTDNTTESNKLYINNNEGTPLIKGDFSTCQVTFRGGVTGSSFTGSFFGDGTNLTGVTAEWDGSRNGDASITGSLIVSGSTKTVDFSNTAAVSGSTFSGSFVGDGSGLTGVTGDEWDGTRNGNANITGSLIVSGALDVGGTVTIASGSYPGGPGVELIQVNASSITSATNLYTFPINGSNNYTGFKADYVLTDTSQASKKVGTLLGSWNPAAGTSVINEEHTLAVGAVTTTSFSIDASSTTEAIFKVNVTSGTFEINALITAFKRVV